MLPPSVRRACARFTDAGPCLWALAGLLALVFLAAVLWPAPAHGGWGGGSCGPVGPAAFPAPVFRPMPPPVLPPAAPAPVVIDTTAAQRRRAIEAAKARARTAARKHSCECDDDCECGTDCRCSAGGERCCDGCKCLAQRRRPKVQNFGVDTSKIHGTHHRINGREVSREEALKAIRQGAIPDDAKKVRGTVIGPDAARKQVIADLASDPALADYKDSVLWQEYTPDQWAVKDAGFKTDGSPTIYLEAPDGKVLHRQDDYNGPRPLAKALRRADPAYDPKKDPDLRHDPDPPQGPGDGVSPVRPCCAALAASLALLVLTRRKED